MLREGKREGTTLQGNEPPPPHTHIGPAAAPQAGGPLLDAQCRLEALRAKGQAGPVGRVQQLEDVKPRGGRRWGSSREGEP